MALIPHPPPATFMDLDYIRYMIGFPRIQMVLTSDGQWQAMIEDTCRFLDTQTNLCTVHNTPRKPKTCAYFNPHQCWYKRNFHNNANPAELIRIDLEVFETMLEHIRFDEAGNIAELPTWESIRDLANNLRTGKDGVEAAPRAAPLPVIYPAGAQTHPAPTPGNGAPGEAELIPASQVETITQ